MYSYETVLLRALRKCTGSKKWKRSFFHYVITFLLYRLALRRHSFRIANIPPLPYQEEADMQESMWARLRDFCPGTRVIHTT